MKPVLTPALRALSLSTLLALCGPSVAVAQNVAVVNGKPIPKARLNAMMAQFAAEAARNNQPLPPNLEAQVRTHLIKEAIIVQQAERQKLHLTSEYAEKMASARGALLASMLFEQYKKDHPISDAAAKAEYDRILASIPAEQSNAIEYNARHILVKTADEARAVAEATDKLRTAVHSWRTAQAEHLSTLDARITKEVSDAVEENNRRRPAVAAGTVRVRYVAARCPSPDLPATAATGSVGDGAGVELTPAAGLDVLLLREALIQDRAKIEYLQGYIRKITEPVGLGLKGSLP